MNINYLAKNKQRLSYASSWFGILGMPLLIVDLMQKKLMLINIYAPFYVLIIITLLILIASGYLAEKKGLIKAEANWSWEQQELQRKELIKP